MGHALTSLLALSKAARGHPYALVELLHNIVLEDQPNLKPNVQSSLLARIQGQLAKESP